MKKEKKRAKKEFETIFDIFTIPKNINPLLFNNLGFIFDNSVDLMECDLLNSIGLGSCFDSVIKTFTDYFSVEFEDGFYRRIKYYILNEILKDITNIKKFKDKQIIEALIDKLDDPSKYKIIEDNFYIEPSDALSSRVNFFEGKKPINIEAFSSKVYKNISYNLEDPIEYKQWHEYSQKSGSFFNIYHYYVTKIAKEKLTTASNNLNPDSAKKLFTSLGRCYADYYQNLSKYTKQTNYTNDIFEFEKNTNAIFIFDILYRLNIYESKKKHRKNKSVTQLPLTDYYKYLSIFTLIDDVFFKVVFTELFFKYVHKTPGKSLNLLYFFTSLTIYMCLLKNFLLDRLYSSISVKSFIISNANAKNYVIDKNLDEKLLKNIFLYEVLKKYIYYDKHFTNESYFNIEINASSSENFFKLYDILDRKLSIKSFVAIYKKSLLEHPLEDTKNTKKNKAINKKNNCKKTKNPTFASLLKYINNNNHSDIIKINVADIINLLSFKICSSFLKKLDTFSKYVD